MNREVCVHFKPIGQSCPECLTAQEVNVLTYPREAMDAAYKQGMMRAAEIADEHGKFEGWFVADAIRKEAGA